jgi:hypothetical protein
VSLGTTVNFPIFNGRNAPLVTTYDGWRGTQAGGKFDPQTDRFIQPASFFGPQPTDRPGNETRYNSKLRQFPNFSENVSLAKTIPLKRTGTDRFPGRGVQRVQSGSLWDGSDHVAGPEPWEADRRRRSAQWAAANAIRTEAVLVGHRPIPMLIGVR